MTTSKEHQEYEKSWWGDCGNTYGEEEKQLIYAKYMGLKFFHNGKSPYNIDLKGKSVTDIGGGPVSMLIKCVNKGHCSVIDPCDYRKWVSDRYKACGIDYYKQPAEIVKIMHSTDEVWCYNVLQHTKDPGLIIENMKSYGKIIRLFEWVDTKQTLGHPHILNKEQLDKWLGGSGQTVDLKLRTLKGRGYYGVFKGNRYEGGKI